MTLLGKLCAFAPCIVALTACSDFFGEGPDPSRAGRFHSGGTGGSGSPSGGAGGTSPAPICDGSQPVAAILAANGVNCPEVVDCIWNSCSGFLQSCFGTQIQEGNFNGGVCPTYIGCLTGCGCGAECLTDCANNPGCGQCLGSLQSCQQSNCGGVVNNCQGAGGSGGSGGAGGAGGSGGAGQVLTELANYASDIALDDAFIYFTTQNGLGKTQKSTGESMSLGGISNLYGLALAESYAYVVEQSGGVTRVSTSTGVASPIVPPMFSGGSGDIVLDSNNIYYITGPNLRRAPIAGNNFTDLARDARQGGQWLSNQLALAQGNLFYVAQPGGGMFELRMLPKDAPAAPPDGTNATLLVNTTVEIRALVADSDSVYFTTLSSDVVSSRLEVKRVNPQSKALTVVAISMPAGMNNPASNTAGGALALDAEYLYFGGISGLHKVPLSGGDVITLASDTMPGVLAVDATHVYWTEQGNQLSLKKIAK